MEDISVNLLRNLGFIIPEVLVISACIYYLFKKFSLDGFLMVGGSLLGLLLTFFHVLVIPLLYRSDVYLNEVWYAIASIIGFLAHLAFAIGFFMLVHKVIKRRLV